MYLPSLPEMKTVHGTTITLKVKNVSQNTSPQRNARRLEEPGQSSSRIMLRKPLACWALVIMWAKWNWREAFLTNHTRSLKELIKRSSLFLFTSLLKWSTPHPLSLIITEWAWKESFRPTSGRFLAFQQTPPNAVYYESGETTNHHLTLSVRWK